MITKLKSIDLKKLEIKERTQGTYGSPWEEEIESILWGGRSWGMWETRMEGSGKKGRGDGTEGGNEGWYR